MIKDILKKTDHRPWPINKDHWKYYQEWNDVIFLHWKVDLDALEEHIPKELEIDQFDGNAWISLVIFNMDRIHLYALPSFPPVSNFQEINIRTYVKYNGKSGVYFLSIEANKKVSCFIARLLSNLPYRHSSINRSNSFIQSSNKQFQDRLEVSYAHGSNINTPSDLDIWLTERYALFQDHKESILSYDIHHYRWPLQKINLIELDIDYQRFDKLLVGNPNLIHYSTGVQVLSW